MLPIKTAPGISYFFEMRGGIVKENKLKAGRWAKVGHDICPSSQSTCSDTAHEHQIEQSFHVFRMLIWNAKRHALGGWVGTKYGALRTVSSLYSWLFCWFRSGLLFLKSPVSCWVTAMVVSKNNYTIISGTYSWGFGIIIFDFLFHYWCDTVFLNTHTKRSS